MSTIAPAKMPKFDAFESMQKLTDIGFHCIEISQVPMTAENVAGFRRSIDELGMKVPKGIWDMLAQSVSDLESEVRGLANSIEMMGSEGSDIMECVRGIREMERTLDRAYYEMTKTIFRADIDPKAVIMLLRIVDAIEMAADTCKACSDTVAILHYAKRV